MGMAGGWFIGRFARSRGRWQRVELKEPYRYLLALAGIGKILAVNIMLETGPISRFTKVGNYIG